MKYLGHYINGGFSLPETKASPGASKSPQWKKAKPQSSPSPCGRGAPPDKPKSSQWKTHFSPADFEDQIFSWPALDTECPKPVFEKGKEAYLAWTRLPLSERVKKLRPLKTLLKENLEELAQIISRETGKPLWESEGEVKALIGKTDFVLGPALDRIKTQVISQAQGRIRFKSRGLFVVIGPFNFPLHLPFGQILPALVSGNSLIFKPSEKAPASGQKLAELFDQLHLPPGVFQMIQGGAEVSESLCRHKDVDAVLFTGSFEVGQKIKEALVKDPSKLLALEMGGYNSALIWDYKDKKQVLEECLKGCFWSAGQRCSSTSQILIHKKKALDFIPDFVQEAQKITVDHWSKRPFMGPLIDSAAVQRFFSLQEEVQKKGGKILLRGERLKGKKGYYVTPGIYQINPAEEQRSFEGKETFTPQVLIYETDSLDQAISLINRSGYGLVLSLFTEEKNIKEEIFHRAKVGLINYNLSSVGAGGRLPFGGLGKSGNDRPAGAFAIDFCVSPLAERGG